MFMGDSMGTKKVSGCWTYAIFFGIVVVTIIMVLVLWSFR